MQYRTMKNGDELSILGFGCMRLPQKDGGIDEKRAIAQIHDAIGHGVNYLDTAWSYHGGESERLLGRALQGGYREKVRLATKLPTWIVNSRGDMDSYLDAQLQKLATDHIDYYLLHSLDGATWDKMRRLGVLEFLDAAQQDGRIVNPGFSFHGLLPDFKRIVDAYPWIFCQIQYNYLDQKYQAGTEGLEYAASRDLGVIVMEPLRGGNIGLSTPPPAIAELWEQAPLRRSPAEWALRWLWNRPEVTLVLSGMNDEEHIQENLAIAGNARAGDMGKDELALVDRVARRYNELMKVSCTGCGYCMPCPSDVLILNCFEEYNKMHMFGNADEVKFRYALKMSGTLGEGKPGFASQCVSCGECLDKCPQQIPIPDFLGDVAAEMEGPGLEQRIARARELFRQDPD